MSDILYLNCLVLGQTPDHIFLVKISSSENVHTLKKAIKDENSHLFSDVDAHDLLLYRTSEEVSNLDDDDLIEALNPLGEGHRKLPSRRALSIIFKDTPSPDALHVLIQLPSTSECSLWLSLFFTDRDRMDSVRLAVCI